jgi:hypothetical protein
MWNKEAHILRQTAISKTVFNDYLSGSLHSYANAQNSSECTEAASSTTIIREFIQDKFWELVNPVTIFNPLILLSSRTYFFHETTT